jgi:hypothetical protein
MLHATVVALLSISLSTPIALDSPHQLNPLQLAAKNRNTVIAQKYADEDPHGRDPHGSDPHNEQHDQYLPANEANTYHGRASDDVYNYRYNNTSTPSPKPANAYDDGIH